MVRDGKTARRLCFMLQVSLSILDFGDCSARQGSIFAIIGFWGQDRRRHRRSSRNA